MTPWAGGRTHVRVRKTGYRPADTTVVVTPGAHSAIRVTLLSLIVVTPPLKVCEP